MRPFTPSTDEELLCSDEPAAFGMFFYDRYVTALLRYFARRTGDPEVAADLTAETFASAIVARRRFKPDGPPAAAWLCAIAARRLADYRRRGRVDARLRRSLQMERRPIGADDARMIWMLADDGAGELVSELPSEQCEAIAAHVIGERGYPELAGELQIWEAAVRQSESAASPSTARWARARCGSPTSTARSSGSIRRRSAWWRGSRSPLSRSPSPTVLAGCGCEPPSARSAWPARGPCSKSIRRSTAPPRVGTSVAARASRSGPAPCGRRARRPRPAASIGSIPARGRPQGGST
jgi:RNA polymerase sigma factor (sigma-70 family)